MGERVKIVTACDEAYSRLLRVLVGSLGEWGGAGDAERIVYDAGLGPETCKWLASAGCTHRIAAPSLPANPWVIDTRYRLLLSLVEAIGDAARESEPDDVIVFIAPDVAICPCEDSNYIPRLLGLFRRDQILAPHDVFTFSEAASCNPWMYARRREDANSPEFWRHWFGADLTGAQTWNTGVIAGRADVLAPFCAEWMALCLQWAMSREFYEAFNGDCIDQLAFSVLMGIRAADRAVLLPMEYNFTRVLWHLYPDYITQARAIHLTGPIKPWNPGAAAHPMTICWLEIEALLRNRGIVP